MKKFHFRLARVDRVRALEERIARDTFSLAQREVRRARSATVAAVQELATLEAPRGEVLMATVVRLHDQAERLAASVRDALDAEAAAEACAVEARVTWRRAATQAGVLERLQGHAREDWRRAALAEESLELDDLAQTRHARIGVEQ